MGHFVNSEPTEEALTAAPIFIQHLVDSGKLYLTPAPQDSTH